MIGPRPTALLLKKILWVIIEYYLCLYGPTVLKVALLRIMELDLL
jgi:hypothetical protein